MYNLNYKTAESLFDEVCDDFHIYEKNGMIDRSKLIKVVQGVNSDIGLKINKEKETILDVVKGKAELPDDFYILNFAVLCTKYKITRELPQGRHTENVEIDLCEFQPNPCLPYTCSNLKHCNPYQVIEKRKVETVEIEEVDILSLKTRSKCSAGCPNLTSRSLNEGVIQDGYLIVNFNTGKIHINYYGLLEDEDGNLLVLDHPLINDYYEYALKTRILENLYANGEDAAAQKLGYFAQKVKDSRAKAMNIVDMPEFSELFEIWKSNRESFRRRYESIIL
jgi:hypothetical protein